MLRKTPEAPKVCGAKLRTGGLCQSAPVAGKGRCHSHGGAPRSGSPKGNLNALTHGGYVGGRNRLDAFERKHFRSLSAVERGRIPRLERDALALAQSGARPANPLMARLGWNGARTLKVLRRATRKLEADFDGAGKHGPAYCDELLATRNLYHLLCQEPSRFKSAERFADAVCQAFLHLDQQGWPLRRAHTSDATLYYLAWRRACSELYEWVCPDEDSVMQREARLRSRQKKGLEAIEQQLHKLGERDESPPALPQSAGELDTFVREYARLAEDPVIADLLSGLG